MASTRRWALWAAVFILATHKASTQATDEIDYSTSDYTDGSCSFKKVNCAENTVCDENKNKTRFRCICPDGFDGNGLRPEKFENGTGCVTGGPITCLSNKDCHPDAQCTPNSDNTENVCSCQEGFTGKGGTKKGQECTDIDECESQPCVAHAFCKNNPGNFTCECDSKSNYMGDGTKECRLVCFSHDHCHKFARCINQTCQCQNGFRGNGTACEDIDECANKDICPEESTCTNLEGSYECNCRSGYYADKDTKTCKKYATNCNELLQTDPNFEGGRFKVDLDGEGALDAVEVDCVVIANFSITEIAPLESLNSPQSIPKEGEKTVDYPVDLTDLINNSDFCSQEVRLQCTSKFEGGMIMWKDTAGTTHRGWGATKPDMCACGQMKQCANLCNCGFGEEGVDAGLIVDKGQLPVKSVIFPTSNSRAGTYYVGKLRCGPEPFDIPRNCHEAKFKSQIKEDQPLYIDIDGRGPLKPFLVYCNQDAYSHVGIIEIPPDQLVVHRTAANGETVEYVVPGPDVTEVIKGSAFCSQRIEYNCNQTSKDKAGLEIQTASRTLTYIPGGANDQPDSCPCGLTNSCEMDTVECNCGIGGAEGRKDMGLIIDKKDLPILNVKSFYGANFFKIGPLRCSEKQFGIEPNCEKVRQSGVSESYSYMIDPDGPSGNKEGNLEPFLVECEMDANQGVTVVNNENGDDLDLSKYKVHNINYLEVTPEQVNALKSRSTGCYQQVTFDGCRGGTVDVSKITYNGGKPFKDAMVDTCPRDKCSCSVTYTVLGMSKLPIRTIQGGGVVAILDVGPLKCAEIFSDCASYLKFMKQEGALGETKLAKDTLTIDPDGAGGDDPFVARCVFKETIITSPKPDKPTIRISTKNDNPGEMCWTLNYTDQAGSGIGSPQLNALMDSAKDCAQKLTLTCSNAVGTGMVRYKTCGGVNVTSFTGAEAKATCQCGVSGTCDGGPNAQCNCDTSGDNKTKDENYIIENDNLPICEVCMELRDIEEGAGAGVPSSRFIRFEVSDLRCGKRTGIKKNCQMYRQESDFDFQNVTEYKDMWFNPSGKPIIVGCKFHPMPGSAEMIIRPNGSIFEPGEPGKPRNITVLYKGFNITAIKEAIDEANYCTQDLIFFCADSIPSLTGSYGLFSLRKRLEPSDYEIRDMDTNESDEMCADIRFAEQCRQCGRSPKRIVIKNLAKIPITHISLPASFRATIGLNDAECAYVEKDCEAIRVNEKIEENLLFNGMYLIDPDQSGKLLPFPVHCEFNENEGITKVSSDPEWVNGTVGGDGGRDGEEFTFTNTYPTATPEQINSLVQNSEFCWQGVKYECEETPLDTSNALLDYQGQTLTSFGTADNSTALGCACGMLGTCKVKGYKCNCNGKGSMVEQGFVTDADVMPITGFNADIAAGGSGSVTVTDVRCAPSPVDIPKDCAEASTWKERYDINFTKNGEFLISPAPGKVRPFLVYCDFTLSPDNPVTIIKPEPTDDMPVGEDDPDVPYQGPTDEQLKALMTVSMHCYQPVKVDCYAASFIQAGVTFTGLDGNKRKFWSSSGDPSKATCTCGALKLCGGNESLSQQLTTKCNCDIGDKKWRSDAAILDITETGPITALQTSGVFDSTSGKLNLTVGDVFCAQNPLVFDECDTGFSECDPRATCEDEESGYRCTCPEGWQGKITGSDGNTDYPMANGRECIDDDECTLSNECQELISECVNTEGSYYCNCNAGYRHPPGNVFLCKDIDECEEDTHDCDKDATCFNTKGSYRCHCKKGFRGTGKTGDCKPIGQCSCFGDPHCTSFDGRWNHYQGRCTYVMAENNCGTAEHSENHFRVSTNNWDRDLGPGEFSWVKDVIIEVHGKEVVIGQNRKITVDGQAKNSYRLLSADRSEVLLAVSKTGFKAELYTNFGLEVVADGKDEVTVITPASQNNSMCGLCGNYNGNPADDWIVGSKCEDKIGQQTTNEVLFGNSWTVDTAECPVDCDPPPRNNTCNKPVDQAQQVCNRLFNESSPFFKLGCLKMMSRTDLEGFRFSCEYDLCHLKEMGPPLCEIAEAMGSYCVGMMGESFDWRSDEMCGEKECKENEEYKVCGPNSEPTCLSQEPVPISQCQENCYCKEGFMRQGDQCVKAEDCGCIYKSGPIAIGESVMVENCTKIVNCSDHEKLTETDHKCQNDEYCVVNEEGVMFCKEPTTPEPTTPEPTTPEPTTPEPTTPEPTTPEPTTPEPTTPEPTTPEPTTPVPTTPEPTTPEPTTPEPTTTEPPVLCTKTKKVKTSRVSSYTEVKPHPKAKNVNEVTHITFGVRAVHDAHLMLSHDASSTNKNNNLYEIVIGSNYNTKSTIRKKDGTVLTSRESVDHRPLNGRVERMFWVSWKNGLVQVGAQQSVPFLEYQDPQPFTVNKLFVSSGDTNRPSVWNFIFPCKVQPTPPPPPTTPPTPIASTPGPQPCMDHMCAEPNTVCVDGICVCKPGFTADCTHCVDIDECKTDVHDCTNLGQECVNTEGSFICVCQEGFEMQHDGRCYDINECENVNTRCGPHAECRNLLGTYECVCCMGYAKNGELCRRNRRLDTVYGKPGQECCACTGGSCDDPRSVCGTDGKTYANYAAMVVRGCRDNRTIEVSYNGHCEKSCESVKCGKPYQKCKQDAPSGGARCSCPGCSGETIGKYTLVCATNGRIYHSKCNFELIMCLTGRKDISLESSLTPCIGITSAGPVGPWTMWNTCDNPCGRGKTTRTRQPRGTGSTAGYVLRETIACYTTCEDGPCKKETCHNPGQVCEAAPVSGEGRCVCPDCTGQPDAPVCALMGDAVRTFENECLMKKMACELTKNYRLLKYKACEDNPSDCSIYENHAILTNAEGCKSSGKEDIGFCFGKCTNAGTCCRPVFPEADGHDSIVLMEYLCPDNSTKSIETKVVRACECTAEPQH